MAGDTTIKDLLTWEVLDSRGNPTVAVHIHTSSAEGEAIAPSGASLSSHEASFPRDGLGAYAGMGVRAHLEQHTPDLRRALIGVDAADFAAIDEALRGIDPSPRRAYLGGHLATACAVASWLAASAAFAQAPWQLIAQYTGQTPVIPMPMVNIMSGGAHAGSMLHIQDVLVIPVAARSFSEALEWTWRVRRAAAELLGERGYPSTLVADEGGVAAALPRDSDALALVTTAIERARLQPGEQVVLALDVAASQFYREGHYRFGGDHLRPDEFASILAAWRRDTPIRSIEDPFADDDPVGWSHAADLCENTQIVGDDRYATTARRLTEGVAAGEANSILIKPNQVASLSEALGVLQAAQSSGWAPIVSARSGDTEETWLSDLAVGSGAGQIKVGSTTRSERTAKWNRLLQIEATTSLAFAGGSVVNSHP